MDNSFETFLLATAAVSGTIAALAGLLNLRTRYELPIISARRIEYASDSRNSSIQHREVTFEQPARPSLWLVHEVSIPKCHHRWLAKVGDDVRNDYGESVGFRLSGDWINRIRFTPPVNNGHFLLHPDAPPNLRFSFKVVLRSRPNIKRRVSTFCM